MKFKIKEKQKEIFESEFLIFPRQFNGYRYWLCWATIKYTWIGYRYTKFGEMVAVGKYNPKPRKSLLYKNPEDVITSVDIKQENGLVIFDFSADCGKHGTDEAIDGYKLTPERLLKILQDRDDYTDEEL